MLTLPTELLALIVVFSPLFTKPVWEHSKLLLLGAILAPSKRTVTSCLRVLGKAKEKSFQTYHRVLNRARWSGLLASKILLGLIITLLPAGTTIVIGADDTIERRKGKKIPGKGCYRDPVRSSNKHLVRCFGLKWLSLMVMVRLPFSSRVWALPFMTVLCRAEDKNSPRKHKTTIDILMICIRKVFRWLPDRVVVLVVDGAFAAVKLALICAGEPDHRLVFVTRLRMDANLYHRPGEQPKGKRGRKPKKGARQRKLNQWTKRSDTPWEEIEVEWYRGVRKKVMVFSRTGLWHTSGCEPVEIRYVIVRDPEGELTDAAFACTKLDASPGQIIEWVVMRWSVEVTFEEARVHLGMETQRQWSHKAILRATPVILGIYTLVTLMAMRLSSEGKVEINEAAWYKKEEGTFSDCLAMVRRHCWGVENFEKCAESGESVLIPSEVFNHLVSCLALAS